MYESLPAIPDKSVPASFPQPAGLVELDDRLLRQVVGGRGPNGTWFIEGPNDNW